LKVRENYQQLQKHLLL